MAWIRRGGSRLLAATLLSSLVTSAALGGCGDGDSGLPAFVRPDLASAPASDLAAAPDLAQTAPDDLAAPPDLTRPPDLGGFVVCNLGNDPLKCGADATCSPFGGFCDRNTGACACRTPNCRPGLDQTCNSDARWASIHGRCNTFGACVCSNGFVKELVRGLCL